MKTQLRIDFVSDVACPWCIIGLQSLRLALDALDDEIAAELRFHPFEINPSMPAGGQELNTYLSAKYGMTPEQLAQNRETIRLRGEEVGYFFNLDKRMRAYNTFDAHRLLQWAAGEGRQEKLKRALFDAYFIDGENPGAHDVLIRCAGNVGLDTGRAAQILSSNAHAAEVREQQALYRSRGIHSVPAIIINERHLIQGGQPVDVFKQALRQIAAAG